MAKAVINLQKESGGIVKISPVDGTGITEVTVPESGELVSSIGDQSIDGIKTFIKSPIVPTPTTGTQAANKAYVDATIALKTIATGTAIFNSTTNNINLTGIGVGVEIGDVIQISGANDAKNNSEFTVEVITDNNNIIVNQAHANKGTTKNVANRTGDTGVTVKLLAKWYNAPIGLGQGWVDVTTSRVGGGITYTNNTNRSIHVKANFSVNSSGNMWSWFVGGVQCTYASTSSTVTDYNYAEVIVSNNQTYYAGSTSNMFSWFELR